MSTSDTTAGQDAPPRFVKFTTMPHSGTYWLHRVSIAIDGRVVGHLEVTPSELTTWRGLWARIDEGDQDG